MKEKIPFAGVLLLLPLGEFFFFPPFSFAGVDEGREISYITKVKKIYERGTKDNPSR